MYAWYDSTEPEARFYGGALGENPGDPGDGALFRTVHSMALNNIWVPSNSSVWAFRYGYNSFVDDCVPAEFDPSTLGFSQGYLSTLSQNNLLPKFPDFDVQGYGRDGGVPRRSHVCADHLVLAQREHQLLEVHRQAHDEVRRRLSQDGRGLHGIRAIPRATSSSPRRSREAPIQSPAATNTGDAFASFLLGLPATGNIQIPTKAEMFINYFGAYAQDDFRVNDKLTVNFGLRYEHESGMQEGNDNIVVGWDYDQPFPIQVPGVPNLRGGLLYAGVDGAPTLPERSEAAQVRAARRVRRIR